MENNQLPPNLKIWQTALGFANTNVIYTLIKSGVIEQLGNAPKTLENLAAGGNFKSGILYRILRFAVALDIVALSDNQYSLTETGRFLLKDVPGSLNGGIMLIGTEPWQRSWNNLSHSLTTGEAGFDEAMGKPFFEYLDEHPEYGEPYNKWMTTSSAMASKVIPEAYDFSAAKSICDIGGGEGLLLKGILTANPGLKGILFDQESVVGAHVLGELTGRAEVRSGNFFERVPQADLLVMKSVLHDWDDSRSLQILDVCRQAMNENTRLLLIEMVIGSATDMMGLFFDLHMLALLAGKERTEEEFRFLLQRAGLKIVRIIPTKSPLKIIEVSL